MAGYIKEDDLRAALGPQTFIAIFDDDNSGSVPAGTAQVLQILTRAHARVLSRLPDVYKTLPAELPGSVPALLVDAELDYAVSFAFMRHPEYVKAYGEDERASVPYKRAENTMKLVQESILRIADVPPEQRPRNVGGHTVDNSNRIYVDNADGSKNNGDF